MIGDSFLLSDILHCTTYVVKILGVEHRPNGSTASIYSALFPQHPCMTASDLLNGTKGLATVTLVGVPPGWGLWWCLEAVTKMMLL